MTRNFYLASGQKHKLDLASMKQTCLNLSATYFAPHDEIVYSAPSTGASKASYLAHHAQLGIESCSQVLANVRGRDFATLWAIGYAARNGNSVLFYCEHADAQVLADIRLAKFALNQLQDEGRDCALAKAMELGEGVAYVCNANGDDAIAQVIAAGWLAASYESIMYYCEGMAIVSPVLAATATAVASDEEDYAYCKQRLLELEGEVWQRSYRGEISNYL